MEFKLAWQFSVSMWSHKCRAARNFFLNLKYQWQSVFMFDPVNSISKIILCSPFFIYQTLFSDQKRDSKPLSHCCNTNSISASASVAPAALLENHHYRRGVFQFFFRNQTISTLSRTENRPHSEIVGDKRWSGPAEHFKFRWGHKPICCG